MRLTKAPHTNSNRAFFMWDWGHPCTWMFFYNFPINHGPPNNACGCLQLGADLRVAGGMVSPQRAIFPIADNSAKKLLTCKDNNTGLQLLFQDKIPWFSLKFFVKCYSFFTDIVIISFNRSLSLFFAAQTFGSIKQGTSLQNDCTEQSIINKGKTWQLSHSTGCMMDHT